MVYILIILVVIVSFFVIKIVLPVKGVDEITTTQLKDLLKKKDYEFIDVRTPREYKENHIKQFKNIPLQELNQKTNKIAKDKNVIIICQSGMRSKQACKQLKKKGFTNLTNVKNGMSAWH